MSELGFVPRGGQAPLRSQRFALVEGGEINVTWDPPGSERVFTGTLYVPEVNALASFQASIGRTPIGQWQGNGGFGPVQARDDEALTVFGFGIALPAGTRVNIYWFGMVSPSATTPIIWPSPVTTTRGVAPVAATTYADLNKGFATYADLNKAFSTYADLNAWRAVRAS